jgi:hypothetical protein
MPHCVSRRWPRIRSRIWLFPTHVPPDSLRAVLADLPPLGQARLFPPDALALGAGRR